MREIIKHSTPLNKAHTRKRLHIISLMHISLNNLSNTTLLMKDILDNPVIRTIFMYSRLFVDPRFRGLNNNQSDAMMSKMLLYHYHCFLQTEMECNGGGHHVLQYFVN